ncbi:MAG: NADH-quinone oxidoreductase subunit L [Candidatus Omnitrophica bacterium]|nr:NADH-quinone oxidoreductase subunit L [Candidatus Omnitrophota bacterium]
MHIAHFIPLFPFLAFVIDILIGRRLKIASAYIATGACVLSFIFSLKVYQDFSCGAGSYDLGTWLVIAGKPLNFGIIIDPLSIMMLLIVSFIGTFILIYSIGYMHDDPRFSRYFAYISLFMSSMLGLVLADNFILLLIFWEGVGLCSYLLIAFWHERPAAAAAGLKAFVTTRIGDTGFLIGILLLFFTCGTFHFTDLKSVTGPEPLLTIAAILIFMGAMGKSAQFPLHVWLPDAMEGPTAVSALIHAATMVAAGVYLVARCFPLFVAHPIALQTVAVIGGISALMAASMATVNNDIKRVLAYSTISQLGLMMLGLGLGSVSAGTFHLMTHAFFKALLFLCAGSVIHSVGIQDIQKMGGLFSKMKITGTTFCIGTLALAGVPPFAGFWSKDEILLTAWQNHHPVFLILALLTSLLTAFYMARLIFLVLFGTARSQMHPHESPMSMTIPLMVLSIFAFGAGFWGAPIKEGFIEGESHGAGMIMTISTLVSLTGLLTAYLIYVRRITLLPLSVLNSLQGLKTLLINKYYIDEIYDRVLIQPCLRLCRASFDFDSNIVDGLVNAMAFVTQYCSGVIRRSQTGLIQNYLLIQVFGVVLLLIWLLKL